MSNNNLSYKLLVVVVYHIMFYAANDDNLVTRVKTIFNSNGSANKSLRESEGYWYSTEPSGRLLPSTGVITNYYTVPLDKKSLTDLVFVIDLDATLLQTFQGLELLLLLGIYSNPQYADLRARIYQFTIDDLEGPGAGTQYSMWGIIRPHVRELLIMLRSYCAKIVIWTAGQRLYAEHCIKILFRGLPYPDLVLSYDDISRDANGNVVKPLTLVASRLNVPLSRIVALDDNETTFQLNPDNAIHIPGYEPEPKIESLRADDPSLLQLQQWLLTPEVRESTDIAMVDKSQIFTTKYMVSHPA